MVINIVTFNSFPHIMIMLQVDPKGEVDPEVEEFPCEIADGFIDSVRHKNDLFLVIVILFCDN